MAAKFAVDPIVTLFRSLSPETPHRGRLCGVHVAAFGLKCSATVQGLEFKNCVLEGLGQVRIIGMIVATIAVDFRTQEALEPDMSAQGFRKSAAGRNDPASVKTWAMLLSGRRRSLDVIWIGMEITII